MKSCPSEVQYSPSTMMMSPCSSSKYTTMIIIIIIIIMYEMLQLFFNIDI